MAHVRNSPSFLDSGKLSSHCRLKSSRGLEASVSKLSNLTHGIEGPEWLLEHLIGDQLELDILSVLKAVFMPTQLANGLEITHAFPRI